MYLNLYTKVNLESIPIIRRSCSKRINNTLWNDFRVTDISERIPSTKQRIGFENNAHEILWKTRKAFADENMFYPVRLTYFNFTLFNNFKELFVDKRSFFTVDRHKNWVFCPFPWEPVRTNAIFVHKIKNLTPTVVIDHFVIRFGRHLPRCYTGSPRVCNWTLAITNKQVNDDIVQCQPTGGSRKRR